MLILRVRRGKMSRELLEYEEETLIRRVASKVLIIEEIFTHEGFFTERIGMYV